MIVPDRFVSFSKLFIAVSVLLEKKTIYAKERHETIENAHKNVVKAHEMVERS